MTAPARVLDLSDWKLTLPVGPPGKPTEVKQPDLDRYVDPLFFAVTGGGVRFRAPVTGVTTPGSKNPRSELREMAPDGSLASWSSSKGAHELVVVEAITHLPHPRTDGGNAGVVGAQIHDADDDVSVFRLESGGKLWVTKGDNTHYALADEAYRLGAIFEARFVVWRDVVQAYYNGTLVTAIKGKFSGAYFKAGCYTQANKANSPPATDQNYGEVIVFTARASHADTLEGLPVPVVPEPPVTVPTTPSAPPVQPPVYVPLPEPPVVPQAPQEPAEPPIVSPPPPRKLGWLDRLLQWLYRIGGGPGASK